MAPEPLYQSTDLHPAYQLRYGWTGWPSKASLPIDVLSLVIPDTASEWERDGLRMLESTLAPEQIQLTISAKPQVSPVILAGRVKGRIQHHCRRRGAPIDFSHSGRYWYNLHLVLVVSERYRFGETATLAKIRDTALRICIKKDYAVSTLAVLPDHLHIAIRGTVSQSPEEIALSFLNNLAHVLDQRPCWTAGYYAGTFGEYGMAAVRANR